ncbi:hypothetical protein EVAR_73321_1 [Eumeta japonica]|uniref:Uncharacterized protein n=1 Tax=Eumeta variegata TaxID=151549 RepID=A0A4C1T882_EUMVA|nr:hypothetical protein EVAR_73321_1 [Eumeta japonica]
MSLQGVINRMLIWKNGDKLSFIALAAERRPPARPARPSRNYLLRSASGEKEPPEPRVRPRPDAAHGGVPRNCTSILFYSTGHGGAPCALPRWRAFIKFIQPQKIQNPLSELGTDRTPETYVPRITTTLRDRLFLVSVTFGLSDGVVGRRARRCGTNDARCSPSITARLFGAVIAPLDLAPINYRCDGPRGPFALWRTRSRARRVGVVR